MLESSIHAFDIRVVHCNFYHEEHYLNPQTHDGIIHWVFNSVIHPLNLYPISSPDLGCTLIQALLQAEYRVKFWATFFMLLKLPMCHPVPHS